MHSHSLQSSNKSVSEKNIIMWKQSENELTVINQATIAVFSLLNARIYHVLHMFNMLNMFNHIFTTLNISKRTTDTIFKSSDVSLITLRTFCGTSGSSSFSWDREAPRSHWKNGALLSISWPTRGLIHENCNKHVSSWKEEEEKKSYLVLGVYL